ncbi:MAG TPA: hypothetical protein VKX35_04540 [Fermentimonas sp.]|nr:hypothetical protein [Fermentimonas sp.]
METDKYLLIEAYFTGELTANQNKQLEWLLQNDAEFTEAFHFEKEVRDTIVYKERQKIKERLRALDIQEAKPIRNISPWWYAAASVLLLIIATWVFWGTPNSSSTNELFTQYMEPYPNVITPKVRGDVTTEHRMQEAMALYDRQEYDKAANLMVAVYTDEPSDPVAFYLAISYLMMNKPSEAIRLFNERTWRVGSVFSPTVIHWYVGMAYLHQGEREKALQRFQLVADSGDSLSGEASKLIESLK